MRRELFLTELLKNSFFEDAKIKFLNLISHIIVFTSKKTSIIEITSSKIVVCVIKMYYSFFFFFNPIPSHHSFIWFMYVFTRTSKLEMVYHNDSVFRFLGFFLAYLKSVQTCFSIEYSVLDVCIRCKLRIFGKN